MFHNHHFSADDVDFLYFSADDVDLDLDTLLINHLDSPSHNDRSTYSNTNCTEGKHTIISLLNYILTVYRERFF